MAGITQNKQKCLILIAVCRSRKNLIRLEQNEGCSTSKNSGRGINNHQNNDNNNNNNNNSNNSNNVTI